MPPDRISEDTFASGRYLKRKRTQVNYRMPELDVDDTEDDTDLTKAKTDQTEANTEKTVVESDQSDADAAQSDADAAQSDSSTDQSTSDSDSSESGSDAEYGAKVVPKKVYPIFKKQRPTKANIFPFLKLPAEVRNMIYGYALSDPTGLNFLATTKDRRRTFYRVSSSCMEDYANKGRKRYHHYRMFVMAGDVVLSTQPSAMVPQLFATNKQLYEEAGSFLYSNEFVFGDTVALYSFLLHVGPTGAKRLKKIRLFNWNDDRSDKAYGSACFALLASAVNISDFFMDTGPVSFGKPEDAAHRFYRDAFPWLEAVGRAKHRADAAVDALRLDEKKLSFFRVPDASIQESTRRFKKTLRDHLSYAQDVIKMERRKRRKAVSMQ